MSTCRAVLAIALRHPIYLGVYVVFLSLLGVIITGGSSSGTESAGAYEPTRSHVAVVDADGSELSAALVSYLGDAHVLVDVGEEDLALQDALATGGVDVVAMVPEGFGDAILDQARGGGEVPRIEVAYGGFTEASALVEQQALRWVSLASAAAALEPGAVPARVADLALEAAGSRADTEVVASKTADGPAYPLQVYLGFSAYTVSCSVVVCAGLALAKMGEAPVLERTLASPVPSWRRGAGLLAGCATLTLGVWVVTCVVGVVSSGVMGSGVPVGNVALALAALLVFALVPLALAFLLAQLGVGEQGLNAIGNICGLVMSFLGGAWVPIAMMGDAVQSAARLVPTFWTNEAIAAALSASEFTADVMVRIGTGVGVTALFAVALAAMGLAAGRIRMQQG